MELETAAPVVADPLIGRVIAERYRIVSLLGRGGMGVVYEVEHVHIGKFMAMKLLSGELARDPTTLRRFRREAEAASRLSHPNTVQVFDFGRSEGLAYLVMELVQGEDLGQLLKRQTFLDVPRLARLMMQIAGSVGEAHRQGIVHRDLKPENVMVVTGPQGDVAKVLDFGLAKLRESPGQNTVTRQGAILGTPHYMSPEQIRGENVDVRSDVYALGALLYKAATGHPPFRGDTAIAVLTKHITEAPSPPSRGAPQPLPPELDAIVLRCLAKNPADRYPNADALRTALGDFLVSIGETLDPTLRSTTGMRVSQVRVAVAETSATREDVDVFERKLRRRGRILQASLGLLVASIVAVLAFGVVRFQAEPRAVTRESEPNETVETADPIAEGVTIRGHLGRRRDTRIGDQDLFRLVRGSSAPTHLHAELGPLPNMDVVLELVRVGYREPVLRVDTGGVGEGEVVPSFPLGEGDYALLVREQWIEGRYPTENVSDVYTLRFTTLVPGPSDEHEVNDSVDRADPLPIGAERVGYVGWAGDEDVYCVDGESPKARVSVTGVPELDLVLRIEDRALASDREVDTAGEGAGETAELGAVEPGRTCVRVRAKGRADGTHRASSAATYAITVASEG